jgi:Zn-dependent metalloprotease
MGFGRRRSAKTWVRIVTAVSVGSAGWAVGALAHGADPASPVVDRFVALASRNRPAIKAGADDAYSVYSTTVDADGSSHVRLTRTYKGLRVYGGDFVLHADRAEALKGVSVGLAHPLGLSTTPKVSAADATTAARRHFGGKITSVSASELIVDATSGEGRLAWETRIEGWAPDGQTPSRLHVITDAMTGVYIGQFDEIETVAGSGNSLHAGTVTIGTEPAGGGYQMIDLNNNSTCDMNNATGACTVFTDADNVWGDGTSGNRQSAAVDAHYGAAVTFDYYLKVHGRLGVYGDGRGVPSQVHYGNNYNDAFWDLLRQSISYGDGMNNARPVISIDVAAHELTHGLTDHLVPGGGLNLWGETGGLNEANADILGTAVEFYANNPSDPGDYVIGEQIDIHGDGRPMRYMYDPSLDGHSYGCYPTGLQNVDPHHLAGVANHFFFDLAEGTGATIWGTSPVCGSARAVVGIGRAKAEQIWYWALSRYFTSSTTYVDPNNPGNTARAYTLRATADLYGLCSREYLTVEAAWNAVNVTGSSVCPPVSVGYNADRLTQVQTPQSHQLMASGGLAPYQWTVTGVPTGMAYNAATGLISGTASTVGEYSVVYSATDVMGASAFGSFTWIVYGETRYFTRAATATKPSTALMTARSRVRTAATAAGYDLANCQETDNTIEVNDLGTYDASVTLFCFR